MFSTLKPNRTDRAIEPPPGADIIKIPFNASFRNLFANSINILMTTMVFIDLSKIWLLKMNGNWLLELDRKIRLGDMTLAGQQTEESKYIGKCFFTYRGLSSSWTNSG